jgi:2-polyprenyl-3-methyl-5-hydroxy-6-metoxy-1,4-benzoquinol methylase
VKNPEDPSHSKAYWEDILTNNCNLAGVVYLKLGISYNDWQYLIRIQVFQGIVLILYLDTISWNVLDIASGTGFYTDRWKQLGVKELTGIDLTSEAVDRPNEKFPMYTIQWDSFVIPFR